MNKFNKWPRLDFTTSEP